MSWFVRHFFTALQRTTAQFQPLPKSQYLYRDIRRFLSLLLGSIMGKVRKHAGKELKSVSHKDPSSATRKPKKSVGEQLVATQNVRFKAKSDGAAENPSSTRILSAKVKKINLKDELSQGSLSDKIAKGGTSGAAGRLIKISSAKTTTKTGSSNEKIEKRIQEGNQQASLSGHIHSSKKFDKYIHDVPLVVEMPKVIDASDSTLSELDFTLVDGISMEIGDSVSDYNSSSDISLLVSDSQFSDESKADIPLAVVMPAQTSSLLPTEKSQEEKQLAPKDNTNIIMPQGDQSDKFNSFDNISINEEFKASKANPESVTNTASGPKKELSQKEKVLQNVKVHLVDSSVVLQLVHPVQFFIFGQVKVQVLQGKIQILGYEMDNKSGSHVVSCLRGSSFLSIQTSPPQYNSYDPLNLPADQQDKDTLKALMEAQNSNDVWVLLKEGNQDFLEYIQMYLEYPISLKEYRNDEISLLSQAQEALNCIIEPELAFGRRINESETWKDISQKITQEKSSCTVLCGGKGVGKSTLLRYLINQILSNREVADKGVVVLDLDLGQAELTPPGCVAVSLVKEPLLGPNYTHLQQPEKCVFVGEVSVMQCLGRYIEASADIIKFFRESPHISSLPCIVNTMGFTQGIGKTIMGLLLKLLRPTRVVQIESRRHRDNYPFHLTSESVLSYLKTSDALCIIESLQLSSLQLSSEKEDLHYQFTLLQSAAEAKSSKDENVWGMKPRVSRNAVILSYFSSLAQPPSYSILDDIPFSCYLGSLFVCVAHEQVPPNLVLAALNANLVALCQIDPHTSDVLCHQDPGMPRVLTKVPIAPCIGFGIVRGVDMDAKILYLSTPLKEETLSVVNCLIFGAVNLPPSVHIKSTAPGVVPYVSSGRHPELSTQ